MRSRSLQTSIRVCTVHAAFGACGTSQGVQVAGSKSRLTAAFNDAGTRKKTQGN